MTETDLSPQPIALLYTVYFHEGIDVSGLARKAGVDKTSAGRLVTRLSDRGYLNIVPSQKDKRQKEVYLTAEGKKLFKKVIPQFTELSDSLLDCFTKKQAQQFIELLEKFVHSKRNISRAPIDLP